MEQQIQQKASQDVANQIGQLVMEVARLSAVAESYKARCAQLEKQLAEADGG